MALMQELTNSGRVVGGHLTNSTVSAAKSDLVIQLAFKRQKLNSETVREWEEITTQGGVVGVFGQAAARAALPGRVGKAVGAGLGAAMHSGHTVRVDWVDGKQSLIELPEKLFMVLSVLLSDRRRITEAPEGATPPPAAPAGMTEQFMSLASSVMSRGRQEAAAPPRQLHNQLHNPTWLNSSRSSPPSATRESSPTRSSRRRRPSFSSVSEVY